MELQLQRVYFPTGTNGILRVDDEILCYTIELPWRYNIRMRSCIPEGRYELVLRYSDRHKTHLLLRGVPSRTLILIHPANDAEKEPRRIHEKHAAVNFGRAMRFANDIDA